MQLSTKISLKARMLARKLKLRFFKAATPEIQIENKMLEIPLGKESSKPKAILEIVPTKKNATWVGKNWLINFSDNRFSEHGEDGVIAKIFEILKPENKWVCEFGAHDPETISNTWRLINQEGWNALLIEADDLYFEKLKNYYKDTPSVQCLHTKVSYEGNERLDSLLEKTPVPTNLDFMVIDIDGNDYHVWEAINTYKAKVVMIEFNAAISTEVSFIQARDLSVNQGTSLRAMVDLANKKGYKLIAATSWNAFFVEEKYYSLFFETEPSLESMYTPPARHPIWTRAFQLYDGTIVMAPWDEMLWHKVDLKPTDYQVLPESYRRFSKSLAARNYLYEKTGSKTSLKKEDAYYLDKIFKMPGNVVSQFARNVFSRYGEDGILEKLAAIITQDNLYFVDVGAGDGITQSRSRYLAERHYWHGILLENDPVERNKLQKSIKGLSKVRLYDQEYGLSESNSLDRIFTKMGIPREFSVLLLNNYGMEYYLWESLLEFSPNLIAIQFNPTIPNDVKFVQPKDFSIHQGCSLRALYELAHYKGYELVGVTLETAFFLKRKFFFRFFELFKQGYTDLDDMFCPAQMHLSQLYDGTIALNGLDRLMWHGIRIDEEKLQVIPRALRKFHQYFDTEYKNIFYRI